MRRSAPMPVPRRYDSARAACVAPRASLGRLRSLMQAPVAPAFNRSPHSSSPAVSDTASAPALQADIMCGPSSPEVSDSVMEEPGAREYCSPGAQSDTPPEITWVGEAGYGSQRLHAHAASSGPSKRDGCGSPAQRLAQRGDPVAASISSRAAPCAGSPGRAAPSLFDGNPSSFVAAASDLNRRHLGYEGAEIIQSPADTNPPRPSLISG